MSVTSHPNNKYTVTTHTQTGIAEDSLLPSLVTLIITPKAGETIIAGDFLMFGIVGSPNGAEAGHGETTFLNENALVSYVYENQYQASTVWPSIIKKIVTTEMYDDPFDYPIKINLEIQIHPTAVTSNINLELDIDMANPTYTSACLDLASNPLTGSAGVYHDPSLCSIGTGLDDQP